MNDAATCPLCGRANHCAIADGRSSCWCFTTRVPDGVVARVTDDDRRRRCVCEACIEEGRPPESAAGRSPSSEVPPG